MVVFALATRDACMSKALALFDFDGTITTTDSYAQLLRFIVGDLRFAGGVTLLGPLLLGFKLGILPNYLVKPMVTKWFLNGFEREKFNELAQSFVKERLNRLVRPAAMKKILWHLQQQHRVIVVSASFEDYLQFWCQQHRLELIGTRLEWVDDRITGRFATRNCYGPEKVIRIREYLNLDDYDEVYAYGDSRGDREMLEIAQHKGYRVF